MQVELNSDTALTAANALIAHLRKNPGATLTPARELAETFGLDESFVAQVLESINAHRRPEVKQVVHRTSSTRSVGQWIRGIWLKITNRPVLFVLVTFALSFLAIYGSSKLGGVTSTARVRSNSAEGDVNSSQLLVAFLMLGNIIGTFVLHMAVYFRHRRARYAVYGGLFLYVALLFFVGLAFVFGQDSIRGPGAPNLLFLYSVAAVGLLMVALMYVGMGSLSAVLGGWMRFKLQEKAEESMTRQELLERYFELQSRLQKTVYPRAASQESAFFKTPFVEWYRRNQFLANAIFGLAMSSISIFAMRAGGFRPGSKEIEPNAWFFVMTLVGISEFLLYVLQGYLSRSVWKAILGGLCIAGGGLLARIIPLGGGFYREFSSPVSESLGVILNLAISCAGYLGAVVQSRAEKETNLMRNDQATLLAEMVRLQWKLSNEAAAVCVMVIDAAKSSEMKASANPLAVEYTFRQYQEWIEQISAERGGKVHSTAGDGAVVAFTTCGLALSAARQLQTDIFRFNKDLNRLQHPFRLRIGLHTGEIIGDIDEVQFTEVIDIAAHIESACPIGGIAVTDDVVQKLPDEQFIDLSVVVDGHQVYMISNPTEYH